MTQKNNPGKFTIQLNPADPCHQQTIDVLNEQGRRKAQFIVNAIMHYIHCSETPDIPQPMTDTTLIEGIVRRILNEQSVQESAATAPKVPPRTIRNSENIALANPNEMFDTEGIATIAKTLASFRHN